MARGAAENAGMSFVKWIEAHAAIFFSIGKEQLIARHRVTGLEELARVAQSHRRLASLLLPPAKISLRATAMAIGPVAFLMKSFDDEKFIAAVRDALSQA